jgi:plastocyanin
VSPQATSTPQDTSTPASGNVEVSIQNFAYTPQNVTIAAGATVRWTNNDTYAHTVTSPGNFDSGNLNQGQTFQYTFNTPGTYTYFCAFHSNMTGTITVTGSGGNTATPETTAQASSTPQATAQATSTTVAGAVQVNIQSFAFSPQSVTVSAGTKVRWTNNDSYPHTVTSPGNFNSGQLNQGQSYEFTFNTPGTYSYICDFHGNMTGSVTVQQPGAPTNTPRPTNTVRPTNTPQPAGTPQATSTPVPSDVNVDILNYAYSPMTITVRTGTTVHWLNKDNDPHSVTSLATPPLFDSGVFNHNGTWQYTFNTPGTYSYFCTVHGTYMTGWVIVEAAPTATPTMVPGQIFSDVRPADYFYEPVNSLVGQGIISGYADNTFRPYNNATRAQVTKMVVLSEGWTLINPAEATFSDVAPGTTFYSYIETGVEHGIISGYADDTFRPNNQVTRGQITKIVVLARGWNMSSPAINTFSDVPVGSTFFRHVETAAAQGILGGYSDGTFRPGNNATRGQVAKILYNALLRP